MDVNTGKQSANQQAAKQAALRQRVAAEQKKKSLYKKIIIAVTVLVLLVAAGLVYKLKFANSGIKKDQYQAVFLTNGQVYFGKLSNPHSTYLGLTDVFYLQVQNDQKDAQSQDQNQQNQGSEPQLIKLGEELHGPEDEMKISKDQVTFWENLKEDSKVVKAIKQYSNK